MFWQTHDTFDKELKKFKKSHPEIDAGIKASKRLLETQFHPTDPRAVIGPNKIHRVTSNQTWEIWKLDVVLVKSGLRPNQWPRLWLAISGDTITFLLINSHIRNYDNNTCDRLALERYTDIS